MVGPELSLEATRLLSVAIAMVMEDHADAAVSTLPRGPENRRRHFAQLKQAGEDIVALATAADILLRLSSTECS